MQSVRFDQLGVVASSMCAVHCALGAVFVGASGFSRSLFSDERLELAFLVAAVGLAITSITMGYRRHHARGVVFAAAGGLFFLAVGRVMDESRMAHASLSVLGGALLVLGHVLNARLLHRVK